jgi:hypothetical protein
MAQKVQVLLTCDLEAGEKLASQTIRFTIDGSSYEIDLCDKHAKQLRDGMATFTAAGRRVSSRGGAGRRGRAGGGSADRQRAQEIREWARRKGLQVSERGRLSADVIARYESSRGR